MEENKEKTGRPTDFTPELGKEICSRISDGESVRKIVKDNKMPCSSTIFNWLLDKDKKEFLEQYNIARNVQAELMFEELLEIADNKEDAQRDRLRVDTRKWYLSKVLPKKFGDKLDMTTDGKPLQVIVPQPVAEAFNINDNTNEKTGGSNKEQEQV